MRQTITLLKVRFNHFVESLTSTAIGKSLKLPIVFFPYEIRLKTKTQKLGKFDDHFVLLT